MANLRGSNFEKQVKDGFFRLQKFREGRHNKNDNFTHSLALQKKREMYLRDIAKHAKQNNFEGKLNKYISDPGNLRSMLKDRLEGLSAKSAKDYVAGVSSMVKGLRDANITIDKSADKVIKDIREEVKTMPKMHYRTERAIENPIQLVRNLEKIDTTAAVIAQVQLETGFRTSEAYQLVQNPDKYLQNNQVVGMIGKGNHSYAPKEISTYLAEKIKDFNKTTIVSHIDYIKALREATGDEKVVPHDLRYTYAKNLLESKLAQNADYKEALKEVSRELNHNREEITRYYLARA